MALKWKGKTLSCGLFTFEVESQGRNKWHWSERNLAWSDNEDYASIPLAQAACEKWLKTEVLKMLRQIGIMDLKSMSDMERMHVAALMSKL